MPTCLKCAGEFPRWVKIEGKGRNLRNRKYCLECSPFGRHNTKRLHKKPSSGQCVICQRGTRPNKRRCDTCNTKVRRLRVKIAGVAYLGGKCEHCGWIGDVSEVYAYDFHHLRDKQFAFAEMTHLSWDKIRAELDKCQLLCARCHRLEHGSGNDAVFLAEALEDNGRLVTKKHAALAQPGRALD